MADSTRRSIRVHRTEPGRFAITNDRGGQIIVGSCTSIDVDILTSRRAQPESFDVTVDAEKIRDDEGNRLTDIAVTFRVRFPDGDGGDAARALLPDAAKRSHDRLCTVARTVEVGTAIATRIE